MSYSDKLGNRIQQLESERDGYKATLETQEKTANNYYNDYLDKKQQLDNMSPDDPNYEAVHKECQDSLDGYYGYSEMASESKEMIASHNQELGDLKKEKEEYDKGEITKDNMRINEDYEEDPPLTVHRPVTYELSSITKQLNKLYELDLYVYIAGVYIPTASVSISNNVGGTPTATISVPPDPTFLGIGREDRIPVQIFIKDTFSGITSYRKSMIPILFNSLGTTQKYENYIQKNNIHNNKILLFSGTITSYSYVTTSNNRTISLMCDTDLSVLTDIKIFNSGDINGLLTEFPDGSSGSAKRNTVDTRYLPTSLFYHGLELHTINGSKLEIEPAPTPPKQDDFSIPVVEEPWQEKTPFRVPGDFMDNVTAFLSEGDTNPNSDLVAFYENYCKLIRLKSRYLKVPFFDNVGGIEDTDGGTFPILSAIQKDATGKLIGSIANNISTNTPYDFLNSLSAVMEYEFALLNTPRMIVDDEGIPRMGQMLLKPLFYEALPPTCNIIQKEHILEVNFNERVHGVPTRIIAQSLSGVSGLLGMSGSKEVWGALTLCYPFDYDEKLKKAMDEEGEVTTPYRGGLLDTPEVNEKYTGPYVHKFSLPPWLDYINFSTEDSEEYAKSQSKLLWAKHMFVLSRAEYKTASVTMTFNPYITVGLPAIIIDADTYGDFNLIAYVVSVEHYISKGAATTNVGLSQPRLLKDEMKEDGNYRLTNTLENITKVTQDAKSMDIVYRYLYGCNVYDFMENGNPFKDNKRDPRKAYQNNWRDICTLEEYYDFLAYDPKNPTAYKNWRDHMSLKHREVTYNKIDIPYLTDRRDPDLVKKLEELRDKLLASDIYGQVM